MPVGAAIGGLSAAGAIGSALIGSSAAQTASDQQVAQDQLALRTQVQAGNEATRVQAPFVDVGTGAAHSLADLYGLSYASQGTGLGGYTSNGVYVPPNSNASASSPGGAAVERAAQLNFTNSPDYNFAFTQGLQALDRSAAAGGTLQSGGQVKAAQEFGQGLASQQYGNYYNRLLSLAQIGTGSANSTSNSAVTSGNNQGNTLQGIGTAQAAGTIGSANALGGGLTGIGSAATTSLLLSKLGGTSLSGYNNSTSNYGGLSNVQQDSLQDNNLL